MSPDPRGREPAASNRPQICGGEPLVATEHILILSLGRPLTVPSGCESCCFLALRMPWPCSHARHVITHHPSSNIFSPLIYCLPQHVRLHRYTHLSLILPPHQPFCHSTCTTYLPLTSFMSQACWSSSTPLEIRCTKRSLHDGAASPPLAGPLTGAAS